MIIRAIDNDGDWQFGKGKADYLTEDRAIAENIVTRLRSFLNDCFFDTEAGVDWITYLGTPFTQNQLVLKVKSVILLSYGVVSLTGLDVSVNRSFRKVNMTYTINTFFSKKIQQDIEVVNYA